MRLQLLPRNIYGHTAVVTAILRLCLTQVTMSHSKTNFDLCFFQFTSVTFVSYERHCFTKKKLASMDYSKVNCTNPKTGTHSEIIEVQVNKILGDS